jgi:ribosome-associated protein
MNDLRVTPEITIPEAELEWRFSTSGGPGGQHANRSATRAELVFDLSASVAFPAEVKAVAIEKLAGRAKGGVVVVTADSSRSQWRNRQAARRRLAELLASAVRVERPRRPTAPGRAARRRRLDDKRRRSDTKRLRRKPDVD